ncbi:hypothetical protein EV127DRAFT_514879 [Xylaria flabelliformis]|nr:hypothetical protein EV127DRAFT_514879 [Xylaria flabelliformis]
MLDREIHLPSMDVLGTAVAIRQLLAQAISLWQQFQVALDSAEAVPEILANISVSLSNLSDIILDIEREPELRTSEIHAQLNIISSIVAEVCQQLAVVAKLQQKSASILSTQPLQQGPRDEAKLADILKQLEKAKAELVLATNLIHLGITADEIWTSLQNPETINNDQTRESSGHELLIQEAMRDGDQINDIMDLEGSSRPDNARITGNVAHGEQRNVSGGKEWLNFILNS